MSLQTSLRINNIIVLFIARWNRAGVDVGLPADDVTGWKCILALVQSCHLGVGDVAVEGKPVSVGGNGVSHISLG